MAESKDPPKLVRFMATAMFADGTSVSWDIKEPRKHDIIEDIDLVNWDEPNVLSNPIYDTTYRFAIVQGDRYPTVMSYYPVTDQEWLKINKGGEHGTQQRPQD